MRLLLIFLFVLKSLILLAQQDSIVVKSLPDNIPFQKNQFYGLRVFTENDFLSPFAPNLDDNYTGGLKVEFITNQLASLRLGLLKNDKWDIVIQNVAYGLTVFTPQDLAKPTIITTDRPYASYNFLSVGSSFVSRNTYKTIVGYELFAGKIGSQAGRNFQSKIHREHWFGTQRPVPEGWQYQIANGGAVALNARVFIDKDIFSTCELTSEKNNRFTWVQGSWINEINIGQYLTNLATSLPINILNINRVFGTSFSANQSPVLPSIAPNTNVGQSKNKNNISFNLYFTPRVRLVAHNATLSGKLLSKPSVYTVNPSELNRALVEYDLGLRFRYHFFNVGLNLSGRSKEFKYQQQSWHNWGGVYVALVYQR